jgi:hypothetical protein
MSQEPKSTAFRPGLARDARDYISKGKSIRDEAANVPVKIELTKIEV